MDFLVLFLNNKLSYFSSKSLILFCVIITDNLDILITSPDLLTLTELELCVMHFKTLFPLQCWNHSLVKMFLFLFIIIYFIFYFIEGKTVLQYLQMHNGSMTNGNFFIFNILNISGEWAILGSGTKIPIRKKRIDST